ncbi:MAG: hypothetical protein ACON5H_08180 [Akkermansiaceae bacterium]
MSSEHPIQLRAQITEFITSGTPSSFGETALAVFQHQFAGNPPYRSFCEGLGHTPDTVCRWQEIPAVPNLAFKVPAYPLSVGPITFLTSGTTGEIRGSHHFPETALYDLAALTHWRAAMPDLPLSFLSPSPQETPNSSLAHMFDQLQRVLDPENSRPFLIENSRFHLAPLFEASKPLVLSGTALAFLHLMETQQAIPLPEGSHLLETGGYKGTARSLEKSAFYQQLSDFFDVPDSQIHNEYGMTELSSQAYASGSSGHHCFPHWCQFQIICPETEKPLPAGKTGYLQIHDLANLHSAAAIRTQDFATSHPDGSFTLIGRDPGALPRGCSRSSDDSLTPATR